MYMAEDQVRHVWFMAIFIRHVRFEEAMEGGVSSTEDNGPLRTCSEPQPGLSILRDRVKHINTCIQRQPTFKGPDGPNQSPKADGDGAVLCKGGLVLTLACGLIH